MIAYHVARLRVLSGHRLLATVQTKETRGSIAWLRTNLGDTWRTASYGLPLCSQ